MAAPSKASLTYHLRDHVLQGRANDKMFHSLTQRHPMVGIAAGRYRVYPPVQHLILGTMIVVAPVNDAVSASFFQGGSAKGGTGLAMVGGFPQQLLEGLTAGLTATAGPTAVLTNTLSLMARLTAGPAGAGSSPGGERPFILAGKFLTGINSVFVLNGFRELVDALAAAGGGTLEVVG